MLQRGVGQPRSAQLEAAMNRDHAGGQIEVFHAFESRSLEHRSEIFLARMNADRLREVTVAGCILCDYAAEQRKQGKRVGVVERGERFVDLRKLQHDEPSARA